MKTIPASRPWPPQSGIPPPTETATYSGNQLHWADGAISLGKDDCEEENEHGGNVEDEQQHDDADDEPTIGWTEDGQRGATFRDGELEPSLGPQSFA